MFSFAQHSTQTDSTYIKEIEQWHKNREVRLKSETGWLNVAGLMWLKEGENTFGSGKENDIVFPEGKADKSLGVLILKNDTVYLKTIAASNIQHNSKPYNGGIIYTNNDEENPPVLAHRSLRWFIIKRGTRYAIRLRDLESEALKNFTTIEYFPADAKWCIKATYQAPEKPTTIPVQDIIGLTTETPYGGTLHFEINGKLYELEATLEYDNLFIVFADATTGNETYGGGRFLYAKKPQNGATVVVLDFNKAYNPPCCFTNFATCPLPTAKNRLSIAITAGEKTYGHH